MSHRITWSTILALGLVAGQVSAALIEVRTIDGTGNNLDPGKATWGAAGGNLGRLSPAAYPGSTFGDTIVNETDPPARANPRDISNMVSDQSSSLANNRQMSDMVWQWGQFLDHDISLTNSGSAHGTADIPINDPADPFFPSGSIPMDRAEYDPATGVLHSVPREQVNGITSYIDASNVYGSDSARAAFLRTGVGGQLKTSAGNLLPFNDGTFANAGGPSTDLFLGGDIRANEQIGLTAMHTLFVREHNRLANLVSGTDDEKYETARKIVGAEIEIITYGEFLPALLGAGAIPAYGGYDTAIEASIYNEFSTGTYRFGHSMLSPNLRLVQDDGTGVGAVALRDAFFNPGVLAPGLGGDPGNLDLLLKGLTAKKAQEIDLMVVDDVRNFLFGPPGAGGLDLASLNIQRGRDQGLPDYNTLRNAYGLTQAVNWADITSDVALQAALAALYGDVDNIDAWVGGLAEDHLPGASVGGLVHKSLVDQFTLLRDGDRFFYLNDPDLLDEEITSIIDLDYLTLAQVIFNNTDIDTLQPNVFLVPEPTTLGLALLGALGLALCLARGVRRR